MRAALFTRRVDETDSRAGFLIEWIRRLAKKVDYLYVVCIEQGEYSLPDNVEVLYLGSNKLSRFIRFLYKNPIRKVDAVLCHQNPIYTLMFAPSAKLHRKKLVSWYAHGNVDFKMKLMCKLADTVITSTPEGCRYGSPEIIGQGIDTKKFKPPLLRAKKKKPVLLTVGRISPVKRIRSLIAMGAGKDYTLRVVGKPTDDEYYKDVVEVAKIAENVKLVGGKTQDEIVSELQNCDVFINHSATGSLDKAALEAMACGCLILTSNEAVAAQLFDYYDGSVHKYQDVLTFDGTQKDFEKKLNYLLSLPEDKKNEIRRKMRGIVTQRHSLNRFIQRVYGELSGIK